MTTTTMCIHRDIYPHTDHGYTWVEFIWFERAGERVSPIIPAAGSCERLASMPGGAIQCDIVGEQRCYASEGVAKVIKSQTIHDDGFYRVGPVCIVFDGEMSQRANHRRASE